MRSLGMNLEKHGWFVELDHSLFWKFHVEHSHSWSLLNCCICWWHVFPLVFHLGSASRGVLAWVHVVQLTLHFGSGSYGVLELCWTIDWWWTLAHFPHGRHESRSQTSLMEIVSVGGSECTIAGWGGTHLWETNLDLSALKGWLGSTMDCARHFLYSRCWHPELSLKCYWAKMVSYLPQLRSSALIYQSVPQWLAAMWGFLGFQNGTWFGMDTFEPDQGCIPGGPSQALARVHFRWLSWMHPNRELRMFHVWQNRLDLQLWWMGSLVNSTVQDVGWIPKHFWCSCHAGCPVNSWMSQHGND